MLDEMQLAQGRLRSHLIFRRWHDTHESARGDFESAS